MSAPISPVFLNAIEACQACIVDCQVCLVDMAPKESKNECPRCCIECIDACQTAMKMMVTNSQWAAAYCGLCAEICAWCAEQCGAHEHDHCQRCAETCSRCADACHALITKT